MQKKNIGFGFRGWMLIIYQFIAFLTFVAFTNWPMNALSDMYGGQQTVSTIYTMAQVLGIATQLLLSRNIGKVKNIKVLSMILGGLSMVFALGVMLIQPAMLTLWYVAYFLESFIVTIWCTFTIGILVGQWFPRRKGTVMGIVTFAFPIGNALVSAFAGSVFSKMATLGRPDVAGAFLPYFILGCVGLLIGGIFVKDYPEQCGSYRDNDKSFTPEAAKAMIEMEIKNKKTTVWTLGNTFRSGAFWCLTIPMGLLLMTSIGMMTQTISIIGSYGYASDSKEFGMIMLGICVVACFGSWLLGVIDTKLGTRRALMISTALMIVSGIFGLIGSFPAMLVALACLAIFMGAASNFTVSGAVQYWRIEDFPSVFARVNPVASLLSAFGPMVVALLLFSKGFPDPSAPFIFVGICGVISVILVLLFKPANVRNLDNKYRAAAGKPVDEALASRK
jgi:OFA family oxalate/formate antiporter-like MFS transporter